MLNRTPAFYPVRRACAPIAVVVVREENSVRIFGVNDTQQVISGHLRYGLFTLSGEYVLNRSMNVTLPANTSVELTQFDAAEWDKAGIDKTIAFAVLNDGDRLLARHRLILPRFCELKWTPADVTVQRDGERVIFSSKTFAWGVCLDLDGQQPLPDNFFDVWPGMDYSLPWPSAQPLPRVMKIGNLCR
jgi:beta-mannosidase